MSSGHQRGSEDGFAGGLVEVPGLDVLRRHGYLDADFYARLIATYPRRSDDIRRVATSNSAAANIATQFTSPQLR